MRFSFNNRSLGNGCRMMHFLVLASFRGRTKKDEGGRNEKSGMVFYGEKMTKRMVQSYIIKPSLEISLIIPKERIVILRVAGLAVPGCNGPSTVVRSTTYAVLLRNQFCRELRAHDGRGGGGGIVEPYNPPWREG